MSTKRLFFFDHWERELLRRALDQMECGLLFESYSNVTKEQQSAAEFTTMQIQQLRKRIQAPA